jgi:hypothetical protein
MPRHASGLEKVFCFAGKTIVSRPENHKFPLHASLKAVGVGQLTPVPGHSIMRMLTACAATHRIAAC